MSGAPAERDWKTNPIVGDIVRSAELGRTFEVMERLDNGCSVNQSKPCGPKKVFVPASMWIKFCATAGIIRRGDAQQGEK